MFFFVEKSSKIELLFKIPIKKLKQKHKMNTKM